MVICDISKKVNNDPWLNLIFNDGIGKVLVSRIIEIMEILF